MGRHHWQWAGSYFTAIGRHPIHVGEWVSGRQRVLSRPWRWQRHLGMRYQWTGSLPGRRVHRGGCPPRSACCNASSYLQFAGRHALGRYRQRVVLFVAGALRSLLAFRPLAWRAGERFALRQLRRRVGWNQSWSLRDKPSSIPSLDYPRRSPRQRRSHLSRAEATTACGLAPTTA